MTNFEANLIKQARQLGQHRTDTLSNAFTDLGRELISEGQTDREAIRSRFDALALELEADFTEESTLPQRFVEAVAEPDDDEFEVIFDLNIVGLD